MYVCVCVGVCVCVIFSSILIIDTRLCSFAAGICTFGNTNTNIYYYPVYYKNTG